MYCKCRNHESCGRNGKRKIIAYLDVCSVISVPHQQLLIEKKYTHGGVFCKKPHHDKKGVDEQL